MIFTNSAFNARNGLIVNNGLIYANNGQVGINTPNGPLYSLQVNATDGIVVPVGNTGQRPFSTSGVFRYNTDTQSFEGFANGAWGAVGGGSSINFATTAQLIANTANVAISPSSYWGMGTYVTLTDAVNININLASGINFSVAIGGNRTLNFPTNIKVGQEGKILVQQDGTGGRTLNFAAGYLFDTGIPPSISTVANKFSLLAYTVIGGSILITMPGFGIA